MKYHFYLTESGKAFSDESVKNSKRPSICTLIATAVALLTLLLDLIVKRTDILSFFRSLHWFLISIDANKNDMYNFNYKDNPPEEIFIFTGGNFFASFFIQRFLLPSCT